MADEIVKVKAVLDASAFFAKMMAVEKKIASMKRWDRQAIQTQGREKANFAKTARALVSEARLRERLRDKEKRDVEKHEEHLVRQREKGRIKLRGYAFAGPGGLTGGVGVSGDQKKVLAIVAAGLAGQAAFRGLEHIVVHLIGTLGRMVDEAGKVQDAMITLAKPLKLKLGSGSGPDMGFLQNLKKELLEIPTRLPGSTFEDIAGIATVLAKMGIEAPRIAKAAEAVAALSLSVTDVPADKLAEMLASITGAYGIDPEQIFYLGSAIDKLGDSSKATANEIMQVANRAAPAAAKLRLAPKDLLAFATVAKDARILTHQAGGSLSRFINRMSDSDFLAKAAKVVGITADEFKRITDNDPGEAMQKFLGALSDMSARDMQDTLSKLGISETYDITLIKTLAARLKEFKEFQASANSELHDGAYAFDAVKLAGLKYSAQLAVLNAEWKRLSDLVGEAFIPAITAGIQHLTRLIKAFVETKGAMSGVTNFMAMVTEGLDAFFYALENPQDAYELFLSGLELMRDEAINILRSLTDAAVKEMKILAESMKITFDPMAAAKGRSAFQITFDEQKAKAARKAFDQQLQAGGVMAQFGNPFGVGQTASQKRFTEAWQKMAHGGRDMRKGIGKADLKDKVAPSTGGAIPGSPKPNKQSVTADDFKAELEKRLADVAAARGDEAIMDATYEFQKFLESVRESLQESGQAEIFEGMVGTRFKKAEKEAKEQTRKDEKQKDIEQKYSEGLLDVAESRQKFLEDYRRKEMMSQLFGGASENRFRVGSVGLEGYSESIANMIGEQDDWDKKQADFLQAIMEQGFEEIEQLKKLNVNRMKELAEL